MFFCWIIVVNLRFLYSFDGFVWEYFVVGIYWIFEFFDLFGLDFVMLRQGIYIISFFMRYFIGIRIGEVVLFVVLIGGVDVFCFFDWLIVNFFDYLYGCFFSYLIYQRF